MKRQILLTGIALLGLSVQADFIRETARDLPIITNVDVVVVGGSVPAVAAATAARAAGASVFLAAPRPYLGEDLAGTLRLDPPHDAQPETLLAKKLFFQNSTVKAFNYTTDRQSLKPHRDEFGCKLSDGRSLNVVADTVQYTNDVRILADLTEPGLVSSIEAVTFRATHDYEAASAHLIYSADGKKWSGVVEMTPVRETPNRVRFKASVNASVMRARIAVLKAPSAKRLLISELIFHTPDTGPVLCAPSPLHVKRTLDAELLTNDVAFITGAYVTETVCDSSGVPAGVVLANRSGRQIVLAKTIIDTTERASAARLAGALFTPYPKGIHTFERRVLAADEPDGDGVRVERTDGTRSVSIQHGGWARADTRRLSVGTYVCSLDIPMADGSFRSFARAEQIARDRTFVTTQVDASDSLFEVPSDKLLSAPETVFVIRSGTNSVDYTVRLGMNAGRNAAAAAKRRGPIGSVTVKPVAVTGATRSGEIHEFLNGLHPFAQGHPVLSSSARDVPIIGEYDTVVIGGGTAGAPAAIAAARSGAKTLLIEYLHVLGGIGTEGMIGLYCYGNVCGFTSEHDRACKKLGAAVHVIGKAETWRRQCREAGAEIWFGTMGCGAVTKDGKIVGVLVATPDGRGAVLAKTVVDATGNADIAAAAGAPCVFQGADEIAVQGAGFSPHLLGKSYVNTDFSYVNDGDAEDLWLFGVRARAGAPREAWDISQVAGSRERRRVVGMCTVGTSDVVNDRTFPDTILRSRANFDSHGYSTDDLCYISEADGRRIYTVNVPYRAILPASLDGLAVVGLGASCHRDVMPMVRMQPDLQNMGFAAGLAAAMAVKKGGSFRAVEVPSLQRKLVEAGNLPKEVLTWKDNTGMSPEDLLTAVRSVGQNYHGIARVLTRRAEALPLLRQAYREAKTETERRIYAHVLGILGDPTGVETLAEIVSAGRPVIDGDADVAFGRRMDGLGSRIIALGRTRDPRAVKPLLQHLQKLNARTSFQRFRALSLASEAMADPALAPALAAALRRPEIGGYAKTGTDAITPLGGYGGNGEMRNCLRELGLARALFRCGDSDGLARRTLEAYARDPRGILALHANAVLQ